MNSMSTPSISEIGAVEAHRLKLRQRAKRIGLAIERQRRIVLRVVHAVRVARLFFLEARGIRQHELAQVGCAGRAEHPSAIAVGDQARQIPRVIEVRMGEHRA